MASSDGDLRPPATPPPPAALSLPSPFRRSAPSSSPSARLEIRLFYVRFIPCDVHAVPPLLTLSHLRRDFGATVEINGTLVPSSDPTAVSLRRDRIDLDGSEVTYVSTDSVRIAGAVDFEVSDDRGNLVLCGTFERVETPWCDGQGQGEKGVRSGWNMDCYSAASLANSAFVQPKLGIVSPTMEVYVAGCFAGVPLILTQTIQLTPRRKNARFGGLQVIPEDEEAALEKVQHGFEGLHSHGATLPVTEEEADEDDPDMKLGQYYPEGWYTDEDGQLTWFNAGVRVGVGIGLGMCVGIGIGVGLLMRSYQTATRGFKRRFF